MVGLMASIDHQYHVPHLLSLPLYLSQCESRNKLESLRLHKVSCMGCEVITFAIVLEPFLSSPPWGAFLCQKMLNIGFGTRRRYRLTAGGFGTTLALNSAWTWIVTGFPPSSSAPYPETLTSYRLFFLTLMASSSSCLIHAYFVLSGW